MNIEKETRVRAIVRNRTRKAEYRCVKNLDEPCWYQSISMGRCPGIKMVASCMIRRSPKEAPQTLIG